MSGRCPNCSASNAAKAQSCAACGAMIGKQAVPWGWAVLMLFIAAVLWLPFGILEDKSGIPAVVAVPFLAGASVGYAAGVRPIIWLAPLGWAMLVAALAGWAMLVRSKHGVGPSRATIATEAMVVAAAGAALAAAGAAIAYVMDRGLHRRRTG